MMKKVFLVLFCLFILSALSAVPYTAQGNINIPTAYILPSGMLEISYTSYFVNDYDGYHDDEVHYNQAGTLDIGLFNFAEIGFVACSEEIYYGHFKLRLLREKIEIPALVFGMENLFTEYNFKEENIFVENLPDRNDYTKNSPYIVASKSALILTNLSWMKKLELVFHLGIGWRKFHGKGSIVRFATGNFGGLDVRTSKNFSMNFEFDAHNYNIGINYRYKSLLFRACLLEIEDYWAMKYHHFYKFACHIRFTFDGLSNVKVKEAKDYHYKDYPYTDPFDYIYDTYPESP
jgi:hypothetical protein